MRGLALDTTPGDPVAVDWVVDTVAPVVTIGSRDLGPGTAIFGFGADEDATFECELDGGPWVACASPR